jgi:TRAP-type C4-dicarboxylate transport system permease small subunit
MEQLPIPKPESNKILKRVSGGMAAIGAAALFVMMLLSTADVIGRKFFMHPIQGTAELVGILLVITASLGLGYTALLKGHLRIGVFTDRFSPRGQAAFDIVAYILGIAASAVISWEASLRMYEYIFKQLGGRTAILAMLIWPFMLVMTIGFIWLTVILIIQLISSFREVLKR